MAFDDYEIGDDGAYTFVDSFSGKAVKAAGVEAKRKAFEIDQRRALSTDWTRAGMTADLEATKEQERARQLAEGGYSAAPKGPNMSDAHEGGKSQEPPPSPSPPPAGYSGISKAPQWSEEPPPAPAPPPVVVSQKSSREAGAGGAAGGDSLDTGAGGSSGGSVAQSTGGAPRGPAGGVTRTSGGAAGGGGGEPWRDAYTKGGNILIDEANKPPPRGGGGGSPVRTVETPTGRSVQISGGMKPANVAEQEAIARREAELGKGRVNIEEDKREEDRLTQRVLSDREKHFEDKESVARDKAQKELAALNEQRAAKLKEIEQGKIDPDRFWSSKSLGQRASAMVGLLLGGVAVGVGGGENPAMVAIDKAIDRDIDAQKTNLQKKQWEASELGQLYETRRKQLGDDMAARNEVKAAALAQIKRQAQQLAMTTNIPAVQQRYAEFELEADKKIAALHAAEDAKVVQSQTFGYKQVGGGGGGPRPLSAKERAAMLKEGGDLLKAGGAGGAGANGFSVKTRDGMRFVPFKEGMTEGEKAEARKRAMANNRWQNGIEQIEQLHGVGVGDSDFQISAANAKIGSDTAQGQGQSSDGAIKQYVDTVRGVGGKKAILADKRSAQDNADELIIQYGGK